MGPAASSLVARERGICRRRPNAFHNLRSASASAISVRTPYLVNRQSDVYEREGIDLDVSTLADWGCRGNPDAAR